MITTYSVYHSNLHTVGPSLVQARQPTPFVHVSKTSTASLIYDLNSRVPLQIHVHCNISDLILVPEILKRPQCLLGTVTDSSFHVYPDVLDQLRSLDRPCVVVAAVGQFRTGKSYLLNKLAGKNKGAYSILLLTTQCPCRLLKRHDTCTFVCALVQNFDHTD